MKLQAQAWLPKGAPDTPTCAGSVAAQTEFWGENGPLCNCRYGARDTHLPEINRIVSDVDEHGGRLFLNCMYQCIDGCFLTKINFKAGWSVAEDPEVERHGDGFSFCCTTCSRPFKDGNKHRIIIFTTHSVCVKFNSIIWKLTIIQAFCGCALCYYARDTGVCKLITPTCTLKSAQGLVSLGLIRHITTISSPGDG